MKKIAAISTIPKDDELKITTRAEKLMKDVSIDFLCRDVPLYHRLARVGG